MESSGTIKIPTVRDGKGKPKIKAKCQECLILLEVLNNHWDVVHKSEQERFECDKCPKNYSLKNNLMAHIKKEHSARNSNFQCVDCSLQFKNNSRLSEHRKAFHSDDEIKTESIKEDPEMVKNEPQEENLQCDNCPLICKTARALKMHIKKVHNIDTTMTKENLKCDICPSFSCNTKNALKLHIKNVHNIKNESVSPPPSKKIKIKEENEENNHSEILNDQNIKIEVMDHLEEDTIKIENIEE